MSLDAYRKVQNVTESPRETEYRLFAQVTRALRDAAARGAKDTTFFDALHWNRRLWTTLAADCASDANMLPVETRASIISLSIWVSKYSSKVASGEGRMDALIDINRNIMEGLMARPQP